MGLHTAANALRAQQTAQHAALDDAIHYNGGRCDQKAEYSCRLACGFHLPSGSLTCMAHET